jgi:hypothetical protein
VRMLNTKFWTVLSTSFLFLGTKRFAMSLWKTFVGRETALSPFKEFAVHRGMYGKVSRSSFLSFLSYIGHGVAVIRQFVEIQLTPR